jgi:hypothetical protein
MIEAAIIVVVLLVALPVGFIITGAFLATVLGFALNRDAAMQHEGSELIDLNV